MFKKLVHFKAQMLYNNLYYVSRFPLSRLMSRFMLCRAVVLTFLRCKLRLMIFKLLLYCAKIQRFKFPVRGSPCLCIHFWVTKTTIIVVLQFYKGRQIVFYSVFFGVTNYQRSRTTSRIPLQSILLNPSAPQSRVSAKLFNYCLLGMSSACNYRVLKQLKQQKPIGFTFLTSTRNLIT